MSKIIVKLLIVFIIPNQSQWILAQNPSCQKIDFNRPTSVLSEFEECTGEWLPVLKINSYADTTVQPFRPNSEFHLTTTDEGLSCLQSTTIFTLDENSEIRTAIYFSLVDQGAWINVLIFDREGGDVDDVITLDETSGWVAFSGKVNRTIEHATVCVVFSFFKNKFCNRSPISD